MVLKFFHYIHIIFLIQRYMLNKQTYPGLENCSYKIFWTHSFKNFWYSLPIAFFTRSLVVWIAQFSNYSDHDLFNISLGCLKAVDLQKCHCTLVQKMCTSGMINFTPWAVMHTCKAQRTNFCQKAHACQFISAPHIDKLDSTLTL